MCIVKKKKKRGRGMWNKKKNVNNINLVIVRYILENMFSEGVYMYIYF